MDKKEASIKMIDTQFSLLELVNWRLHWVYCDIDNMLSEEKRHLTINTFEDLEKYRRAFDKKLDGISRMIWEFETMTGINNGSMRHMINAHPKMELVKSTKEKNIQFMQRTAMGLAKRAQDKSLGWYQIEDKESE